MPGILNTTLAVMSAPAIKKMVRWKLSGLNHPSSFLYPNHLLLLGFSSMLGRLVSGLTLVALETRETLETLETLEDHLIKIKRYLTR